MRTTQLFGFALGLALLVVVQASVIVPRGGKEGSKISLADAPSLQLRIFLTRESMKIHGQSVFDVFANPVVTADNSRVRYDGFTTLVEGEHEYTYILADGAGYVSHSIGNVTTSVATQTVKCLSSAEPFSSILSALNNATATSSTPEIIEFLDCTDDNVLETSFGGIDFTFCASAESGLMVHGGDILMVVEYLPSPIPKISAPTLTDPSDRCDIVSLPTSVTPSTLALVTGNPSPSLSTRKLKTAQEAEKEFPTCTCLMTPRPCIFFHGLGNPNEEEELQDAPEKTKGKMGDIGHHAPCCSTIKYTVLNTEDYGWTNSLLQQKFCEHALSMSPASDVVSRTIEDTIIITHSMGGLTLAGALANGECSFGEETYWVSLSAPMAGSMASDFSQDICGGDMSDVVADVMEVIGKCPSSVARKSVSYQNGEYSTPEVNDAYIAAQEAYRGNVSAAMCGKHYNGLASNVKFLSILGGTVIPPKSKVNDGLVEFQSCLGGLPAVRFGDSYLDRFYAAELNHGDTALLTHDELLNDSQRPFTWFECLFGYVHD